MPTIVCPEILKLEEACVPVYSLSTIPGFLPHGAVEKILRQTVGATHGRRDCAVLMLLARLGLRTCEIVSLELEDVDWERRQITVRGTLRKKRVTPHVLRHTTAMELLQAGVDRAVIALWLGHESVETTQIYLDANLALKEDALKKTSPVNASVGRFKPDDQLLAFLRNL